MFCYYQERDNEGIYCTAHIHEGRVFDCPYENKCEAGSCTDYMEDKDNEE